jgi:hypothetical protein
MLTALDAPIDALDAHEKEFVAQIREYGWFNTSVTRDDEGPGFSYTSGLWVSAQRPEVIMFSMKREVAHDIFWDVYRDAKTGSEIAPGRRTNEIFGNSAAFVFPVAKRFFADYLGWSRWLYAGDDFPCMQIVWPDRAGRFPWEQGFDPTFAQSQPDLSENGWLAAVVEE